MTTFDHDDPYGEIFIADQPRSLGLPTGEVRLWDYSGYQQFAGAVVRHFEVTPRPGTGDVPRRAPKFFAHQLPFTVLVAGASLVAREIAFVQAPNPDGSQPWSVDEHRTPPASTGERSRSIIRRAGYRTTDEPPSVVGISVYLLKPEARLAALRL